MAILSKELSPQRGSRFGGVRSAFSFSSSRGRFVSLVFASKLCLIVGCSPEPSSTVSLPDFADDFSNAYEDFNAMACKVDRRLCVSHFRLARSVDVEHAFTSSFRGNEIAKKNRSKFLACFANALRDSRSCVEDSEEICSSDAPESKCEDASKACLYSFFHEHMKQCDLYLDKGPEVFKDAMHVIEDRVRPDDD